ncbi:hypothetical protein [Arthrobacter sp. KBS0702]|uniref:hypothetical protein n=1 Tax=Arthrobacter sp. KBS0702 TaxID=2578107 RepID=UPI0021BDD22D|nr:hypothetical protein [Arthrobacter sp. KBS0702]
MVSIPLSLRWAAVALLLLATASCSAGTGAAGPGNGSGTPASPSPSASVAAPLTAEISQFRDNYSRQIIEIQLTNTTGEPVTVLAAGLRSPLFASRISWTAAAAGTELPPHQTKSLPASLPAASCPDQAAEQSRAPEQSRAGQPPAAVEVLLASAAGATGQTVTTDAADPFGVLARNNVEMCVAQAAAAIAELRFAPELELSPDARTAFLHLRISPRNSATDPADRALTIDSVGGTTLLEEDPSAPWPSGLRIDATGPARELRLGIRPARCDPHAVAEDKVGTLIPLRVSVAGREGVLKIDAGAQLRGRIYDFVTSACGRQ